MANFSTILLKLDPTIHGSHPCVDGATGLLREIGSDNGNCLSTRTMDRPFLKFSIFLNRSDVGTPAELQHRGQLRGHNAVNVYPKSPYLWSKDQIQ